MAYGLAAHCSTSGGEYDCSADEDAISTLYLPSHLVVRGCRLTWTGVGADYVDASSKMAAFDPSAHQRGPNALLLRLDLLERYLSEHDLEMCWAVTGEKQSMGTIRATIRLAPIPRSVRFAERKSSRNNKVVPPPSK